jgi:predicted outer membrane lipoprotein
LADDLDRKNNSLLLGVLLGAAVVVLGVLAYLHYERSHEPVVKIDVPGFSGEIRKDNGGVDIEVGKDKP